MGIFNRQFQKPGPGVAKDEPEKTGFALFVSLIKQHFTTLILFNLIIVFTTLLAQVFFALAIFNNHTNLFVIIIYLLAAVVASLLVGPTTTAVMYCMSKFIRQDTSFIWQAFWKKWKECFTVTTLLGVIYSVITFSQIIFLLFFNTLTQTVSFPFLIIYVIVSLVIVLLAPYYFLQAAYLELGSVALFKNSFLLSIKFLWRSLAAFFIYAFLIILQWLFFPFSVPLILILGYSIPLLIQVFCVWKPIDDTFGIDKELRSRQEKSDAPVIFTDEEFN